MLYSLISGICCAVLTYEWYLPDEVVALAVVHHDAQVREQQRAVRLGLQEVGDRLGAVLPAVEKREHESQLHGVTAAGLRDGR